MNNKELLEFITLNNPAFSLKLKTLQAITSKVAQLGPSYGNET